MYLDSAEEEIQEFGNHYGYNTHYMKELLNTSPDGFSKFYDFLPLSKHNELLSKDEYWVAKIATLLVEDCGECLQLNVKMAREANVDKNIILAAARGGLKLPERLKELHIYVTCLASYKEVSPEILTRIEERYDEGKRIELGICIATAKVFPTIKRTIGLTQQCSLKDIE